mmetsp:Transcript_132221/g.410939  ORF Transcript_132221/g.410939 Transcript_132221/m.410939 type:complete len:1263 (-) Transcript_132221:126-3914(-)
MAVPGNLLSSATQQRDIFLPDFNDLDQSKKVKMVSKLRSQWTMVKNQQKPPNKVLGEAARDLCHSFSHLWEDGNARYLTRCASQVFSDTSDLLAPHPHGIPKLNETILTMAEFVFRLNKPVLAKHGFREDIEGLTQLDQMLIEEGADHGISDAVAQYYHDLCFGRSSDLNEMTPKEATSVKYTGHILWMGLLASTAPLVTSCMSFLYHLALPPLERRLRSYARTIAYAEALLVSVLSAARSLRLHNEEKQNTRERVIWIFNANEHDFGKLALEGYFEDVTAFKSDFEFTTIYLVSPDTTNDFAGRWPCGRNVQVHAVTDHAWLHHVSAPELIFMFHFDIANDRNLTQLLHLCSWSVQAHRPIVVMTCRCEAEARRLRELSDIMGLAIAWPFADTKGNVQRDSMFVRNLYSGMAGNPDIDYDDNGWMAAVWKSSRADKLAHWMEDDQVYVGEMRWFLEVNRARVRWTETFVRLISVTSENLAARCGDPKPGSEFTSEHLALCQEAFGRHEASVAELVESSLLAVITPEEAAEADAIKVGGEAQQPEPEAPEVRAEEEEREEEYRVVYARVLIRAEPSIKSSAVGIYHQGAVIRGVVRDVEGDKWLRIQHMKALTPSQVKAGAPKEVQEAWMLMDGHKLGLGTLLERTGNSVQEASAAQHKEPKEKEAEAPERRDATAKPSRTARSPAVFWGILDLKYDSKKCIEDIVKVLETGDGRLSRFSGCGASIKESFQQDHKLEETIRRAVLTENKKLTHDVIVDHGYGHTRPRQREFRKEYTDDLAERIKKEFSFEDQDLCVLKLCNRARGAGVIPVRVAELDEVLDKLLHPPVDMNQWLKEQPKDWAQSVTWGCFEEQTRHWWTNECPCFLVEECCQSMLTEKEERYFDGTMRVGFSLHREHRNKLPRGWVDSPDGPVRVQRPEGEESAPTDTSPPAPWNDDRPYLDLFRLESSILRVQWLGGYWKLPIEDINSQDLRGKVVSVAKMGTAPVSEYDLHTVYASIGDMVSLLFGANDMSQGAIRARYKSFPELSSFIIARMACSIRVGDKTKSSQLMELARMYMERQTGACKDLVSSYIHRNMGVAEAGHNSQWLVAAEHFKKSILKMPSNANSRHLLGLHYLEVGDPHKAREVLEEVLLLDPDFKAPYACLGVALLRLGNYARAAEVSKMGLTRHPHTPACWYNLGVASFVLAYLEEQEAGKGYIATELRAKALEALETARETRFRDQPWEAREDAMVARLRDEQEPLVWNEKKLPQDGWRVMGWRP